MKKRIVIGLSLILLIFIAGGFFIIFTIESSRSELNGLIKLHQAQMLRDNLLLNVERVQGDIYLSGGDFSGANRSMTGDINNLNLAINSCFSCHHPGDLNNRLINAKRQIETYKDKVEFILNPGEKNRQSLEKSKYDAIAVGNELLGTLNDIVFKASLHLRERTMKVFNRVDTAEKILYASILSGLFAAAVIAFRLQKILMKPIGALLSGAENFSRGDLDYRIPEDMPGELSVVAGSLNNMAAELKTNIEEIKKAEQTQVMGEVAAGLAHEIKNPLAGIKGALEIFLRELRLSDEETRIFEEMLFQIKKLDVMTKSFIEYARPPSPQFVPSSINEIINNALSFMTKHNLHRNIGNVEIVKELDESPCAINADPMLLQQVFLNLAFNALDAMPDGGILKFRTSNESSFVTAEVSDTGHGLDPETIKKIFQPFFTTKTRGLGIGLSISKRLIEQHGGEITAFSSESGTTFRIKFPTAKPCAK